MNKLPLHNFHERFSHLTEFAGFAMPLWYEGINVEHMTVRERVGLFDISHMGRVKITGERAPEFLDYITTRDPSNLKPLQGQYSTMCNKKGGVIDDLIVYNLKDCFLVVYNAINRLKKYRWLVSYSKMFDVQIQDISNESVMFALQGPKAQSTLQKLTNVDLTKIKRFWVKYIEVHGIKTLIMRSGYTGEDGFEIIIFDVNYSTPASVIKFWKNILKVGKEFKIKPCGLGSRDTLRLEAGLCLYGKELTESITPFEAKLDFVVKLTKEKFIGRSVLAKQKELGVPKVRVGWKMVDRGIPRHGCKIFSNGTEVGFITSGGFSPLLKQGIAMGYVLSSLVVEHPRLYIQIREKMLKAKIVKMPFYNIEMYGWKRKKDF